VREIKFRGKSLVTGDWVYGGYYNQPDRRKDTLRHIIVYQNDDSGGQQTIHDPIDIDTLGMYIGEKDINGKEIYEGDIVKIKAIAVYEEDVYYSGTGEYRGKCYREAEVEEIKVVKWRNYGFSIVRSNWIACTFKILGNVYENPEFLKEELK